MISKTKFYKTIKTKGNIQIYFLAEYVYDCQYIEFDDDGNLICYPVLNK